MTLSEKTARALRYAWIAAQWAMVLYVLYTFSVRLFKTRSGSALWVASLVGFLVWLIRAVFQTATKQKLEGHLNAEQRLAVIRLRQIISAYEVHNDAYTWKDYLPLGRCWVAPPPKPSLDELEEMFQECEDAVGPFDLNIVLAFNRIITSSQKEAASHEKLLARYIAIVEHRQSPHADILIPNLVRLAGLYFMEKKYKESAEMYDRAISLRSLHSATQSPTEKAQNDEYVLMWRRLAAVAHASAGNDDIAENALRSLIPVLEEKYGVLNSEALGPQQMMGILFNIYQKQGWKAAKEDEDPGADVKALRYLRDALVLVSKLHALQVHNLKSVGRLFVWTGRMSDAKTAFGLANAVMESNKAAQDEVCVTCGGNHKDTVRSCDACSKDITVQDRWFFCMTCGNVDLCSECYEGGVQERGWERVEKFPDYCIGHEYFEVGTDEKADGYEMDSWITDVCMRLTADMERGVDTKGPALE